MPLVATARLSLDSPARTLRDQRLMRLFGEHGDGVFRLGMLMLGRTDEAEDVVQETFLRLLDHLSKDRALPSARGWIFTVAAHICRDRQRASRRWLPWLAARDMRVSIERPDSADATRPLMNALRRLVPRDRLLVALRAEGCNYQEIAAAAGLNPASTGRIVMRALDRLARELGESR
jgi:RNA polymerase sigma factor (sigma-70 family)